MFMADGSEVRALDRPAGQTSNVSAFELRLERS